MCACWAPHDSLNLGLRVDTTTPYPVLCGSSQDACFVSQPPPAPCCAYTMPLKGRQFQLIWDTELPEASNFPGVWTCWFHQKFKSPWIHCSAPRYLGTRFGSRRQSRLLGMAMAFHLIRASSLSVLPCLLPLLYLNLSHSANLSRTLGPSALTHASFLPAQQET